MFDFWRKKANPFVSAKEAAVLDIVDQLASWSLKDRGEILSAILTRTFPKTHIHHNPRKKVA